MKKNNIAAYALKFNCTIALFSNLCKPDMRP